MSRLTSSNVNAASFAGKGAHAVEQGDAYDGWLVIGRVKGPHGVRGEVRVQILTDFPERFQTIKRLYLGDTHAPHDVERARFTPKGVLLKLVGIDSRETAGFLARSYVALPETELPPLPAGSFHHHQIKGLAVHTDDDRCLGSVAEIITTGSNDVYIVRGGESGEILLPAIAEVVRSIDLETRRIIVHLISGLVPDE
ncbi:MAG: 16S rRNA processing protein RimM [Chloroflexi bacterium]|nr:16S rRNA processing protein RimM [Chloroflexota bacterium]